MSRNVLRQPVPAALKRGILLWGSVACALVLVACSSPSVDPADQPEQSLSAPAQSTPTQSPQSQSQAQAPSTPEVSSPVEEDTEAASQTDTSTWSLESAYSPGAYPQVPAVVTGLRVAEHEDYDRVVLDLTGEGPLGWNAFYTDSVVGQGKGDPLPLEGGSFLNVNVTGVSIPVTEEEYAAYYDGQEPIAGRVVTAYYDSTFEGRAQVAIAVDHPRPFQVFALTDPLRIVIDIATGD